MIRKLVFFMWRYLERFKSLNLHYQTCWCLHIPKFAFPNMQTFCLSKHLHPQICRHSAFPNICIPKYVDILPFQTFAFPNMQTFCLSKHLHSQICRHSAFPNICNPKYVDISYFPSLWPGVVWVAEAQWTSPQASRSKYHCCHASLP